MSQPPRQRAFVAAQRFVVVVASGLLTASAFPDTGSSGLAFVSIAPFLVASRLARGAVEAALLGAAWMLAFAWGINDWFPRAVATYYGSSWAFGFAFFLAVTLLSAAPATALFAVVLRRLGRLPLPSAAPLAAAAWTAGELLRTRLLGDPWGLLGYSQASSTEWIQVADFSGVYGVGFVVVLANALVAESLLALAARAWPARLGRALAAAAVLFLLAPAYGHWRLAGPGPGRGELRDVVVVQGNLDLRDQWRREAHAANLGAYVELTRSALAAGDADLVVWPENAVTGFLGDDEGARAAIARVLGPSGAMLLAGAPRLAARDPDEFRNAAFLLAPDGSVAAVYDKQRLLPFGEYSPVTAVAAPTRDFGGVREFGPGPPAGGVLDAGGLRLGVVICNEALFAEPARDRAAAGAGLLVALTNDTWVGERKFAAQARDKAVLRAVEQGRYLVRASTSGPSVVVDDRGRPLATSPFATATTLRAGVPVAAPPASAYARLGDAFAWLCVAATVLAQVRPLRRLPEEVA